MFSESVDVACASDGRPVSLKWGGRSFLVCSEPVRWYERRQWWAEESRAPLGSGAGLVDHEIWRVQVIPAAESSGRNQEQDGLLTLDLSRHIRSGRWRLLRIHDALHPRTA